MARLTNKFNQVVMTADGRVIVRDVIRVTASKHGIIGRVKDLPGKVRYLPRSTQCWVPYHEVR